MDETEPSALTIVPYVSFPSFAIWSSLGFDTNTFDSFAEQLDRTKQNADPEALAAAVAIATRWEAVDTGAIEGLYEVERGFTYSVAVTAAILDSVHKLKGEKVARAIGDAMDAYEFVMDAATTQRPVTEVWIRELHATICASQDSYTVLTEVGPQERPFPKGQYKDQPNSPLNLASNTVHSYAPVIDTAPEMARLVDELRTEEFEKAHPVVQAAYAHYAFVCIHPFADGNGRVSRALASVYLYRSPGVPLVVFADQKGSYLDALEAADDGRYSLFLRFISERVIDTIGMIQTTMAGIAERSIGDQLTSIESMLTGRGGLQHTEIDSIAVRLGGVVKAAFEKKLTENPLRTPLTSQVSQVSNLGAKGPAGYRLVPNPVAVSLQLSSASPATGSASRKYGVAVARPDNHGPDFVVFSESGVLLEVFLREMYPAVSEALVYRAEIVAENELKSMLTLVAERASSSLKKQGYLE